MLPKLPPYHTLPTNILHFIFLLHSFVSSFQQQICDHQDQSALLAFSENISSSSSLPLNWSSPISCCHWEGVRCDINGRVTYLELPSRGLEGTITSSIVNLTKLTILDLSSNNIHGSIPREIGNLLHLEKLHLHDNNLSGPIPSSLMECKNLVEIFLRSNNLNEDISKLDFSQLAQLRKLDLRNNSLYGTLPESIYSCKSLVAIGVDQNNITGQISPKIVELKSLAFISLAENSFTNITATLKVLAKCNNLTTLFLSKNFYGESLPVDINFIGLGEFRKLQFLNLIDCGFASGPIPNWPSNLKSLLVLNLEGNRFTGRVPNWFGTLPNLFRLNLNNNSLSGELPLTLFKLPAIISQTVQANLNNSQFELPIYFPATDSYIRLEVDNYIGLGLSYNALTGPIPEEIGDLRNLQLVNFSNNYFSGHIPDSISNLKNLVQLDLSRNNLSGEIPTSLTSLSFLSHFDVSYNDLEGRIPMGGQFSTFQESSFEGNPGLCGVSMKHPCSNLTPSKTVDGNGNGRRIEKRRRFLDGLFVGFASGFSGILIVVASYVWLNDGKRRRPSSRRG